MIVCGFAKDYKYADDGTLLLKVRIPDIHGAYMQREYKGKPVRNYVSDDDLPYYRCLELPRNPNEGDVVIVASADNSTNPSNMFVLGLTGGSYSRGATV